MPYKVKIVDVGEIIIDDQKGEKLQAILAVADKEARERFIKIGNNSYKLKDIKRVEFISGVSSTTDQEKIEKIMETVDATRRRWASKTSEWKADNMIKIIGYGLTEDQKNKMVGVFNDMRLDMVKFFSANTDYPTCPYEVYKNYLREVTGSRASQYFYMLVKQDTAVHRWLNGLGQLPTIKVVGL